MKRTILLLLSFAVIAWGCTPENLPGDEETIDQNTDDNSEYTIPEVIDATNNSDDNIANTTFKSTITITFSASGASVAGDDAGIVKVSGNQVTATNTRSDAIKYVLTGSSDNGFFKLYSGKKQALVLKDLNLTNPSGAAINNQSKKRTFVVLEGTNKLADGATYTMEGTEDQKAAFFSEAQLIFSGDGSLTVNATGKAGITSDDYIAFLGNQTVKVSSSAGHGVRGKDYVKVASGTLNINVSANMKKGISSDSLVVFNGGSTTIMVTGSAAYDSEDADYSGTAGIKADKLFMMEGGDLTITNTGKGGKGISGDLAAYFDGGSVSISVSGANFTGSSTLSDDKTVGAKGIKFDGSLAFNGGKVYVTATNHEAIECKGPIEMKGGEVYAYSTGDDAINAAADFTINDGYICGISSANDGMDANGNFYIKGGVVYAVGKSAPELAIDANTEGLKKLYVTGGTIFAVGGLESGASLTQSCYSASNWNKNTKYALTVGDDTYVFTTPATGGTPLVVSGASKPTLKSGVTVTGGTEIFDGKGVLGGAVSGGNSVSLNTYTSSGGGPGGPGGRW